MASPRMIEYNVCHNTPVVCCQPSLLLARNDPRSKDRADRAESLRQLNTMTT